MLSVSTKPVNKTQRNVSRGACHLYKTDRSENSELTAEIPIDETYCPFSRAVLCKTKMENLSVVLFGEGSEESEILNELVEESDDLLLLASSFMRNILPRNNEIFNMFSYKRHADTYQSSPNKNVLITLINLSLYIYKLSIDNKKKTACAPCRPLWSSK